MGLFRRKHRFRPSPLSLSVPLDGCDSVVGLQELQRRKDSDQLAKALNLGGHGASGRTLHRDYKGYSLWNLTVDDFKKPQKGWLDFLWGSDWNSYSLSEGLSHMGERVEENLCYYLPNYLRILVLFILLAMFMRPWSFLGLLVTSLVVLWSPLREIQNRESSLPVKQQRPFSASLLREQGQEAFQRRLEQLHTLVQRVEAAQEVRSQQGNGEQQKQPLSVLEEEVGNSWAYIVCTVAICFTGIPIVLIRSLLWTAVAVLAHSSLRQSPLECVAAKKGVGQSGISPSVGVPFLEVLGLRQGNNPDPRRLLKETWSTSTSVLSAVGIYVWHAVQSRVFNLARDFEGR